MESFVGWVFFVLLGIVNTVMYILIDGYFEGDIAGVRDGDEI